MKFLILCGACMFGWMIISHLLAWMFSSGESDESTQTTAAAFFLAPILGLYLLVSWLQMQNLKAMYRSGLPIKKPSDDIADYLP